MEIPFTVTISFEDFQLRNTALLRQQRHNLLCYIFDL